MNRFGLLGVSVVTLVGATSTLAQGIMIGLCAAGMIITHQVLMLPLRKTLTGLPVCWPACCCSPVWPVACN